MQDKPWIRVSENNAAHRRKWTLLEVIKDNILGIVAIEHVPERSYGNVHYCAECSRYGQGREDSATQLQVPTNIRDKVFRQGYN